MRVIKQDKDVTFITTDEIAKFLGKNQPLIVVGIINHHPCILTKGYNEDVSELAWQTLNDNFILGNGYNDAIDSINVADEHVIKDKLDYRVEKGEHKIAAFDEKDWREALRWLLNNAKTQL